LKIAIYPVKPLKKMGTCAVKNGNLCSGHHQTYTSGDKKWELVQTLLDYEKMGTCADPYHSVSKKYILSVSNDNRF
jgi:hypothetical protein